jgi:hypothetical protein
MIPLLRTLNAMVAAEPRCRKCHGSGVTGDGRDCNWCIEADDEPLEPSADEVERLRAIEREFMR